MKRIKEAAECRAINCFVGREGGREGGGGITYSMNTEGSPVLGNNQTGPNPS